MGRSGRVLLEVGRERGERRELGTGEMSGEGWAELGALVRDSSSLRVCDCQPYWTLTIA